MLYAFDIFVPSTCTRVHQISCQSRTMNENESYQIAIYDRNDAGDSNVSKSKSISKLSSVPPHFHLESSKILPPDLSVYRVISADFFKYPQITTISQAIWKAVNFTPPLAELLTPPSIY
ncbi:predicted protein [Botrytis cinerea T4]|uniref:Uncharacterized protein n=1 Tax=Botryotinia fuckeliana (strain T4) TaxID=999810 RepID=G2YXY8_BOTF4|nr:predicted protein [Botrytis cinerea T4]